ncbi:unnamed protein product [Arctogadus glacialis]
MGRDRERTNVSHGGFSGCLIDRFGRLGDSWAAERQIRGGRIGLGGPHSPDVVEDQLLGGRLNTCGPMDVPVVVHLVVEQQLLVL